MKKIGIVTAVFILAIIAGIFVIRVQDVDTEIIKNRTKVGVVYNGSKQDRSWGQSHFEALEKTASELNLEIIDWENAPEDERCAEILEEMARTGCKIIIADSIGYGEWMLGAARKHPEIHYFHAAGTEAADNLATYFGRIYQMRYLCGIVAGMQTKSNAIGYVAAFPISEVNRGINAFTLGVRSVNPEAKVYVSWCESWTGDEAAGKAAQKLIQAQDIDVLAMHTDSIRVLEIAEEAGIWSVGYNRDNGDLFPDTWLTAAVWNWEEFYIPKILLCLQGKFKGEKYWLGQESGVVSLAPLSRNVEPGTKAAVERERKRFENGAFDVFYGPIRDNEGNLRIREGESMTDDAMLNAFDWYVEGVEMLE